MICRSTTPLRQDTDDRREIMTTALETEDKCPDVIPAKWCGLWNMPLNIFLRSLENLLDNVDLLQSSGEAKGVTDGAFRSGQHFEGGGKIRHPGKQFYD
ncbi:hypothetical protein AVEN_29987-1 [Araneus ventricosus]|uniref:Uncharacterized protein n=1 Tax=Araneus ventricosus TaxID=182803 RepID=A0A4Y2K813_ARAVE|nr:hypothetical protein AVEN_29987-1 [Araneus ventricosus]